MKLKELTADKELTKIMIQSGLDAYKSQGKSIDEIHDKAWEIFRRLKKMVTDENIETFYVYLAATYFCRITEGVMIEEYNESELGKIDSVLRKMKNETEC